MKIFAFSVLFVLFFTNASIAEDYGKPVFYLSGGLSDPVVPSKLTHLYNLGFNFGGGVGYKIDKNFAVRGYLDYNRFGLDTEYYRDMVEFYDSDASIKGGSLNTITLTGEAKASIPFNKVKVWPYLLAGLGYFRIFVDDLTVNHIEQPIPGGFEEEIEFGILFGAGLDYKISKGAIVFAEFKYTIGLTDNEKTHYVPLKMGISF